MSIITDNFMNEAEKKQVQFKSQIMERTIRDPQGNEIPQNQHVFHTGLRISEQKTVPCSVVIVDTDKASYVDYQITYGRIGLVSDRSKLPDILTKLNEIDSVKTGYYDFIITPDGELQLRNLGIIGEDPIPTMSIFLRGGHIIRATMPELETIEGLDVTALFD